MICKSCGKKMIYVEREYAPDTFDCECGEWAEAQMAFNEMKAQKEKAEGELKAIKARIEAVITDKDDTLYYILDDCYCDNNMNGIADRRIKELIKRIGGEK